MRHAIPAILTFAVLSACASVDKQTPGQVTGASGPIAWEVVNLKERHSDDGKEVRWYFTLVLKEMEGRTIQFENLQSAVYGPGIGTSTLRDGRFDRRLEPRSEIRLNYSPYLRSTTGGSMIVFYRFSGKDETGRPIKLDVRVPLVSAGPAGRPSSAFVAPLPPAKPLRAGDLTRLAGRWRGAYRDEKGYEIPVEMDLKEDGSFQAAEDEPVRIRFGGSMTIRDGELAYVQRNDAGRFRLHEGGGKRILDGTVTGSREASPGQSYAVKYLFRLEQEVAPQAAAASPVSSAQLVVTATVPAGAPAPASPASPAAPPISPPPPPASAAGPRGPASAGAVAAAPATRSEFTYKVTYRVSGTAGGVFLTFRNPDGGTQQTRVRLPWEVSFDAKGGTFLYVSAQNQGVEGSVTCEILLDDERRTTSTSMGAYVIAECSNAAERN